MSVEKAAWDPGSRRSMWVVAAAVAVVTFLVYLPALPNDLVDWDDPEYVFKNPHIRSFGLRFFKWAFFEFYAANWHPLTWIAHAADYAVWGDNPLGHHLSNTVLHAVNSFLVVAVTWHILRVAKATSAPDPSPSSAGPVLKGTRETVIGAGLAGLLFGVHPVHVESVAWISERKDLLCGLFFLSSVLSYCRYAVRPRQEGTGLMPPLVLSFIFFVLALMSKPMAVTLPLVLLILDWHPFERFASVDSCRRAILEKIPFVVLSGLSSVITVLAQKSGGAMKMTDVVPFGSRMLVAINAFSLYILKMLFPIGLGPFYPYPLQETISMISPRYILSLALLAAMVALPFICFRIKRIWLSTWGYFMVTLLPVIGIIQVGSQSMADRYLYLPSIGPFLLVGAVAARSLTGLEANRSGKSCVIAASAAIGIAAISATVMQIGIWRNGVVLWSHVVRQMPGLSRGYQNRSVAYERKGDLPRALEDLNTALSLTPRDATIYHNRGVAFARAGQFDRALGDFNAALSLTPSDAVVLHDRGRTFLAKEEMGRAIEDFSAAIAGKSDYASAYYNRGIAFARKGDLDRAVADFDAVLRLDPEYLEAYLNRGTALAQKGELDRAVADFNAAVALRPGDPGGYENRGLVRYRMGQADAAREDYRIACTLGSGEACRFLDTMR